jgi:hypothetical protein
VPVDRQTRIPQKHYLQVTDQGFCKGLKDFPPSPCRHIKSTAGIDGGSEK